MRGGLIVNNNERNEEFDVIDQNLRQGQLSNFEDKSFECSSGLSLSVNESMADSYLDSFRSNVINDSLDSEKPLEISITADSDNKAGPTDNKRQEELVDYDIVESSTLSAKPSDQSKNSELPDENGAQVGPEKQDERNMAEVAVIHTEMYEKQVSLDMIDVTAESQVLLAGGVFDNIVSANEGAGSDIVDIELLSVSPGEGNDTSKLLILNLDDKEHVLETTEMSGDTDKCLDDNEEQAFAEEDQDVKDVNTAETDVVNSQSEIGGVSETSKNSKDDDDGFDNIESDEIFVDARSELSEDNDHSSFEKEENFEEASEGDAEHFEEVHLPTELVDPTLVGQQIHIADTVIVSRIDDDKLDSREGTMLVSESDDGEKTIEDDEKTFNESSQVYITDECKDVQDEVSHESVSISEEIHDGNESDSDETENDLVTQKKGSPIGSPCDKEEMIAFGAQEEGNIGGVDMFDEASDSVRDIGISDVCPDSDDKIVSVEEVNESSVIKEVDNSLPTTDLIVISDEKMTSDRELVVATNKEQVSENEGKHDMEGLMNVGSDRDELDLHKEEVMKIPNDEKIDMNDAADDSNDFEICEENMPSCIVKDDTEEEIERSLDKESMVENVVVAEICEDEAKDDEKVGDKNEKTCEVDVNAYVQIEEVPISTFDKEEGHLSTTDQEAQIADSGGLNCAECGVSEKESENGKIETDTLTDEAKNSDVYGKQKEAVDIPVVDYPMNEDQADESSSTFEEEKKHSTGEVTTDVSYTHVGGGEDQLITAFETRKRLGSFSPGSQRKEPSSLSGTLQEPSSSPGIQRKESSSSPGAQQKEPSSQPVPKERKKKKKKNKKSTVKMLVRDLIQKASDSDGSGVEAIAETEYMAGKPDDVHSDEGQHFVEVGDTDHPHEVALEGGEKQGLDDAGNTVSELKGLGDKSETEDKLSKDQSFDSQDELLSVKEPVGLEDAKCGGTSETSDVETAEAVARGKGKDKSKSKKESKKDGCKSQ